MGFGTPTTGAQPSAGFGQPTGGATSFGAPTMGAQPSAGFGQPSSGFGLGQSSMGLPNAFG